ncbi:MAG: hypothetical protein ACK5QC_13335 [Bacteroidota bacterium]
MNLFKKFFSGKIGQKLPVENADLSDDKNDLDSKKVIEEVKPIITEIKKDVQSPIINKEQVSKKPQRVITEFRSGESIYKYLGINHEFTNQLYFVDDSQKESLLRFIADVEKKFKLSEIVSSKKFDVLISDRFHYYVDSYKWAYKNDAYSLDSSFPYFSVTQFFIFEIQYFNEIQRGEEIESKLSEIRLIKADNESPEIARFNIINKSYSNLFDIDAELRIINNYLESKQNFRYYEIGSLIDCLVDFYLKSKDFAKTEYYFNQLLVKVVHEDYDKLEDAFINFSSKLEASKESALALHYAESGLDFLLKHFPKPEYKKTGRIYGKYINLLIEHGKHEEASKLIDEAHRYNEALDFSYLKKN